VSPIFCSRNLRSGGGGSAALTDQRRGAAAVAAAAAEAAAAAAATAFSVYSSSQIRHAPETDFPNVSIEQKAKCCLFLLANERQFAVHNRKTSF